MDTGGQVLDPGGDERRLEPRHLFPDQVGQTPGDLVETLWGKGSPGVAPTNRSPNGMPLTGFTASPLGG